MPLGLVLPQKCAKSAMYHDLSVGATKLCHTYTKVKKKQQTHCYRLKKILFIKNGQNVLQIQDSLINNISYYVCLVSYTCMYFLMSPVLLDPVTIFCSCSFPQRQQQTPHTLNEGQDLNHKEAKKQTCCSVC